MAAPLAPSKDKGFASADLATDSFSLKVRQEHTTYSTMVFLLVTDYFRLSNERDGQHLTICDSEVEKDIVMSRIKHAARPIYANPSIHGAHIVYIILSHATSHMWQRDL